MVYRNQKISDILKIRLICEKVYLKEIAVVTSCLSKLKALCEKAIMHDEGEVFGECSGRTVFLC